ncbi:hypothetical protein C5D98_15105 [Rathayibacter rathayi]|nr:hypothetical protein C5C15_09450 [Rathayibacter rathayi]PPG94345.1 hypothetical protein C5C22_09185 [Rathayibacter rathayi]PPI65277.1 hypothetical protein C5D98_15105 [Rathayibacter rathayi]
MMSGNGASQQNECSFVSPREESQVMLSEGLLSSQHTQRTMKWSPLPLGVRPASRRAWRTRSSEERGIEIPGVDRLMLAVPYSW